MVREKDELFWTTLHHAVDSGNSSSVQTILALDPNQSNWLPVVPVQDLIGFGDNLLFLAAHSGNSESLRLLITLYPESQRLRVVSIPNWRGQTVLHLAVAPSGK